MVIRIRLTEKINFSTSINYFRLFVFTQNKEITITSLFCKIRIIRTIASIQCRNRG